MPAPSPAAMPAGGPFAAATTSFICCAAVDGTRSPVFVGPRAEVLTTTARRVTRTTPFIAGFCSPKVYVHGTGRDTTAESQGGCGATRLHPHVTAAVCEGRSSAGTVLA